MVIVAVAVAVAVVLLLSLLLLVLLHNNQLAVSDERAMWMEGM